MTLVESVINIMNDTNTVSERHLSLVDLYIEHARTELLRDIESADLRYLSESTNDSDTALDTLNYLYNEAADGFKSKITNAIDKLVEILSEYISDIRTKMQKALVELSANGKIKKISKKIALNPFLRGKSITYEYDAVAKELFDKVYPEAIQAIAKVKAGNTCSSILESIKSRISDWEDSKKPMTTMKAPAMNIIEQYTMVTNDMTKILDVVEKHGKNILKECKSVAGKQEIASENASDILSVGRLTVRVSKISINGVLQELTNCMDSLNKLSKVTADEISKTTVSNDLEKASKEEKSKNSEVKEGTDYFVKDLFGDIYYEYMGECEESIYSVGSESSDSGGFESSGFDTMYRDMMTQIQESVTYEIDDHNESSIVSNDSYTIDSLAASFGFAV